MLFWWYVRAFWVIRRLWSARRGQSSLESIVSYNYFARKYCNLYSGKVIYIINCYALCSVSVPSLPSVPSECEHTNAVRAPNARIIISVLLSLSLCSVIPCFVLSSLRSTRVGAPGVWSLHLIADRHFIECITILSPSQLPFSPTSICFVGWLRIGRSALCSRTLSVTYQCFCLCLCESHSTFQCSQHKCNLEIVKKARVVRNWRIRGLTECRALCSDWVAELRAVCASLLSAWWPVAVAVLVVLAVESNPVLHAMQLFVLVFHTVSHSHHCGSNSFSPYCWLKIGLKEKHTFRCETIENIFLKNCKIIMN